MAASRTHSSLDPRFIRLAVFMLIGGMAAILDSTIVNVAIDALGRDLHATVANTQWVVTAYGITLAMVVPVSGWAMGRYGGKRVWMFSLAMFLTGSVLSSLAWGMSSLIAFRIVQGVGGGLMMPVMMNMFVEAAGGRDLGRLMGVVGLPALVGPILGPVIGGLIVSHLSWRWMFWVNVPLCVISLLGSWKEMPSEHTRVETSLDVVGLALLSPAVALVIYGLSQAGIHGGFGHAVTVVPVALGLALLAAFVRHALRVPSDPIIDLRLFRRRPFASSTSLLFISGLALYGAMLLLPLYYQELRGQSALAAGLLLAPQGVGILLTRGLAGTLTDRIGSRPVVITGLLAALAGTVAFTQAGLHSSEVLLSLSLVVRGAGLGAVTIPIMATAYLGLAKRDVPHASSATRIMQQLGGAFGSAIVAVILQARITVGGTATASHLASAFQYTFWWTLAFTALALVPALLLPSRADLPAADASESCAVTAEP